MSLAALGVALLTPRERDVVRLAAEGMWNPEISAKLNLSEHTVRNYLVRTYDKVGISSRAELSLCVQQRRRNHWGGDASSFEYGSCLIVWTRDPASRGPTPEGCHGSSVLQRPTSHSCSRLARRYLPLALASGWPAGLPPRPIPPMKSRRLTGADQAAGATLTSTKVVNTKGKFRRYIEQERYLSDLIVKAIESLSGCITKLQN